MLHYEEEPGQLGGSRRPTLKSYSWQLPDASPFPATSNDAYNLLQMMARLPSIVEDYFSLLAQGGSSHGIPKTPLSAVDAKVLMRTHQISRIFATLSLVPANSIVDVATDFKPKEIGAAVRKILDDAEVLWARIKAADDRNNALRWRQPMNILMERLSMETDAVAIEFGVSHAFTRALARYNFNPTSKVLMTSMMVSILILIVVSLLHVFLGLSAILTSSMTVVFGLVALGAGYLLGSQYAQLTTALDDRLRWLTDLSYIASEVSYALEQMPSTSTDSRSVTLTNKSYDHPIRANSSSSSHRWDRDRDAAGDSLGGASGADTFDMRYENKGIEMADWGQANDKKNSHFLQFPYQNSVARINADAVHEQLVLIGFNQQRNIILWNTAASNATGFPPQECVGRSVADLIDVDREFEQRLGQYDEAMPGEPFTITVHAMGTRFKMNAVLSAVSTQKRRLVGYVLLCAHPKRDDSKYIYAIQSLRHQKVMQLLETPAANDSAKLQRLREIVPRFSVNHLEVDVQTFITMAEWTMLNSFLMTATQTFTSRVGRLNITGVKDEKNPRVMLAPDAAVAVECCLQHSEDSKCNINVDLSGHFKASVLTLTIYKEHGVFDLDSMRPALSGHAERACAIMSLANNTVVLEVPCFTAREMLSAVSGDSMRSSILGTGGLQYNQNLGKEQSVQLACNITVCLALSNSIDLHNISFMMMKITGVSLMAANGVESIPFNDIDILLIDGTLANHVRDKCEGHGIILVPCLMPKTTAAQVKGMRFFLPRPFNYLDVSELIVELSSIIHLKREETKKALEEARVLSTHRDAPWTKGKLMGNGGSGNVYEAINDLTGGRMAVKMYHFSSTRGAEEAIKGMRDEISIHCRLQHPNIVQYFYAEHRSELEMNLFMEICDESLDDYIKRKKRLSVSETADITRQIVAALLYLQSENIIHRDIKPPNILLKSGVVKLTDFGTAKKLQESEQLSDDVQGTLRYMAPEVYRGATYDATCDVWSVGCVVCTMLDTYPDFMTNTTMLADITEVKLPEGLVTMSMNPHIAVVRDFVSLCLRVDPKQRPTVDALALHPFVAEKPSDNMMDLFVKATENYAEETSMRAPSIFSICSDD